MADKTKNYRRIEEEKDRVRDQEVGRENQKAGINKKGFGGMETRNKGTDTGKKGI